MRWCFLLCSLERMHVRDTAHKILDYLTKAKECNALRQKQISYMHLIALHHSPSSVNHTSHFLIHVMELTYHRNSTRKTGITTNAIVRHLTSRKKKKKKTNTHIHAQCFLSKTVSVYAISAMLSSVYYVEYWPFRINHQVE